MKKLLVLLFAVFFLAACASSSKESKYTKVGAGTGAAGGALLGQAVGGNTAGTLIGAGAGAIGGGLIGKHQGKKKDQEAAALDREMKESDSAQVQRNANVLAVTFKSDVLFAAESANLQAGASSEINRVSRILMDYPDSRVQVAGHTDNTGSEQENQALSEQRAKNVKNALVAQGISPTRIYTIGFGQSAPVADNSTEAGRQQNRRVVITIRPQNQ